MTYNLEMIHRIISTIACLFSCLKVITHLLICGWNKENTLNCMTTTRTILESSLILLKFSLWDGCFVRQPHLSFASLSLLHISKNSIRYCMRPLMWQCTYPNVAVITGLFRRQNSQNGPWTIELGSISLLNYQKGQFSPWTIQITSFSSLCWVGTSRRTASSATC